VEHHVRDVGVVSSNLATPTIFCGETPMTLPTFKLQRRALLAGGFGLCASSALADCGSEDGMYGLIGKMIAKPGQRDALVRLLLGGTQSMPGCRSYIIAA